MLADLYPKPSELMEQELGTLRYLRCSEVVGADYPELQEAASTAYERTVNRRQGLSFESHLVVAHGEAQRRVSFGALVLCSDDRYEQISYYIALCEQSRPSKVLRKFHFDVASRSSTPLFHLQYCGRLSGGMEAQGFTDDCLAHMDPWLSEPRIVYWPVCLAMLMHMVFLEFGDTSIRQVSEDSGWRKWVKSGEQVVLSKYHEYCLGRLRSANKGILLMNSLYEW